MHSTAPFGLSIETHRVQRRRMRFLYFPCLSVAVGVCMLCTQNGWQEKMRSTITVRIAGTKNKKPEGFTVHLLSSLSLLLKCVFIIHWKIYFSQKVKRVWKKRPNGRTNDSWLSRYKIHFALFQIRWRNNGERHFYCHSFILQANSLDATGKSISGN